MNTTLKYVRGQLTLIIPPELAVTAKIAAGSEVELSAEHGKIVIRPAGTRRPSLAELVAQVTDDNRHELVEWGPPVGREVW